MCSSLPVILCLLSPSSSLFLFPLYHPQTYTREQSPTSLLCKKNASGADTCTCGYTTRCSRRLSYVVQYNAVCCTIVLCRPLHCSPALVPSKRTSLHLRGNRRDLGSSIAPTLPFRQLDKFDRTEQNRIHHHHLPHCSLTFIPSILSTPRILSTPSPSAFAPSTPSVPSL